MCGIAGIINLDTSPVGQHTIDRFTDSLAHRGPDGRGVWRQDSQGVALGHRRLSILDRSEGGHQPMSYAHGRYWISFNGEIFNFLEIRDELSKLGYAFASESDTEVILAAYDRWGPEMLLRFNGMWAFAIYDVQERLLFMSRDRFGIKPFHFLQTPKIFAFASELKSFRVLEGYQPAIDMETAAVFLATHTGVEATSRTMLAGVQRLQGGHYAILKGGQLTVTRWWNTLDHLVDVPATLEEQAEQFSALFEDAVKLRMRSDVPTGSCLSGGFDSTSVVCALARIGRQNGHSRQSPDWQQTFIATFPGCLNDERAAAEEVVRYARVRGNFIPMTEVDALPDLEKMLDDFDDVYPWLSSVIWKVYRELRRARVVVSLDGHGADELMGAYKASDYLLMEQAPSWLRDPRQNMRLLETYMGDLKASGEKLSRMDWWGRVLRATLLHHRDFGPVRKVAGGLRRRTRGVLAGKLGRGSLRASVFKPSGGFTLVGAQDQLPDHWGRLNRELYTQFHSTTLPTVLRVYDRLSMAHGIEVRMPFMDWRLVSLVMSLPAESKIGGGLTKRVAREAMRGKIPESIRSTRVKIGFNSPMPEWFAGPLAEWALDLLGSEGSRNHPLIDAPKLAELFRRRKGSTGWTWGNCTNAWSALHYLWFEQNFIRRGRVG